MTLVMCLPQPHHVVFSTTCQLYLSKLFFFHAKRHVKGLSVYRGHVRHESQAAFLHMMKLELMFRVSLGCDLGAESCSRPVGSDLPDMNGIY